MNKLTCIFLILLFSFSVNLQKITAADNGFELKNTCPPGFETSKVGTCLFRSLYQQYESLENKGVGGLKTALPEIRDGFTPMQIDLGRYLFFDPILSGDNSISCGKCHQPEKGFSDGLGRSEGVHQSLLPRSAPTLWNTGFLTSFFWDGRAKTLEQQMLGPLYSPEEMNSTPESILKKLNNNTDYKSMFSIAFPEATDPDSINLAQVYLVIAAFESSLISLNSRYDQYAHGYHDALNKTEIEGMNVFRSFVARCAECHTPPLFTNQQIAVIGTPDLDGEAFDVGAEKTYSEPTLRGGFKVPTLRNIEKSAPYMHSGKFKNLRDAVEFYTKGRGHAVPEDQELILHWHIWEPELSEKEIDNLVAFLKTLTDERFVPEIPHKVPSGLTPISHNNYTVATVNGE